MDYDLQRIRRATGDTAGYPLEVPVPQPVTPSQSFKITQSVVAAQAAASIAALAAANPVVPVAPVYVPQLPVQVPEVVPPPAAQITAQKRRSLSYFQQNLALIVVHLIRSPFERNSERAR